VGVAVLNHLLELRPRIRLGRQRTVYVAADNFHVVAFGIDPALAQLALDGFLTLVVAAVSGVYHNITGWHFCASSHAILLLYTL